MAETSTPGVFAQITNDPETRAVWLILVASVAYLVVIGVTFRAR